MPNETYEYIFFHPILNKAIDVLSIRQFQRQSPPQEKLFENNNDKLSFSELNKAVFLASILACSDKENHQQKAMSLAILAYLDQKNKQFASYCYIILSRVDNIQQGKHLLELIDEKEDKFLFDFDEALNLELAAKRSLATLQLPSEETIVYQPFSKASLESIKEYKSHHGY